MSLESSVTLGIGFRESTNWTFVEGAAGVGPHLNRLVDHYRPWIEQQARMSWSVRVTTDDVQEAVQIFLLRMLEGRVVKYADRSRGSFRGFLRTCLDNCVKSHLRRQYQWRDQLGTPDTIEQAIAREVPKFLDTACALEILMSAGAIVFRRCQQENRDDLYRLIKRQVIEPLLESKPRLSQDELMVEFGFRTRGVVSGKTHTACKWFGAAIDSAIRRYALPHEVEAERADLMHTLPQVVQLIRSRTDAVSHLYSQIELDAQSFDAIRWMRRLGDRAIDTYMDLFTHPDPPLDQLRLVKDLAQTALRAEEASRGVSPRSKWEMPREAAELLYQLPIAVARTRLRQDISKISNRSLIQGLSRRRDRIDGCEPEVESLIDAQLNLLYEAV